MPAATVGDPGRGPDAPGPPLERTGPRPVVGRAVVLAVLFGPSDHDVGGSGHGRGAHADPDQRRRPAAPSRRHRTQRPRHQQRDDEAADPHAQAGQGVAPLVVARRGALAPGPPGEHPVLDPHGGEEAGDGDDGQVLHGPHRTTISDDRVVRALDHHHVGPLARGLDGLAEVGQVDRLPHRLGQRGHRLVVETGERGEERPVHPGGLVAQLQHPLHEPAPHVRLGRVDVDRRGRAGRRSAAR